MYCASLLCVGVHALFTGQVLSATPSSYSSFVAGQSTSTGYVLAFQNQVTGSIVQREEFNYQSFCTFTVNLTKSDQTLVVTRTAIMTAVSFLSQLSGALSGVFALVAGVLGFLERTLNRLGHNKVGKIKAKRSATLGPALLYRNQARQHHRGQSGTLHSGGSVRCGVLMKG